MTSAVDTLINAQALGNVRPLASNVRGNQIKDPKVVVALAASASAHAQEQDQIDKLFRMTRGAVEEISVTISSSSSAAPGRIAYL